MKNKKQRKIRIKRSKWLRGDPSDHFKDDQKSYITTYMCDRDGRMCCLGFAANQISGIAKKEMVELSEPADVYIRQSFLTNTIDGVAFNSRLAVLAIEINDAQNITEEQRETELTKLFKKNGIELEFVD